MDSSVVRGVGMMLLAVASGACQERLEMPAKGWRSVHSFEVAEPTRFDASVRRSSVVAVFSADESLLLLVDAKSWRVIDVASGEAFELADASLRIGCDDVVGAWPSSVPTHFRVMVAKRGGAGLECGDVDGLERAVVGKSFAQVEVPDSSAGRWVCVGGEGRYAVVSVAPALAVGAGDLHGLWLRDTLDDEWKDISWARETGSWGWMCNGLELAWVAGRGNQKAVIRLGNLKVAGVTEELELGMAASSIVGVSWVDGAWYVCGNRLVRMDKELRNARVVLDEACLSFHAGREPKVALVGRTMELVEMKIPEMSVAARLEFSGPAERLVVGGRGGAVVAVRYGSAELILRHKSSPLPK